MNLESSESGSKIFHGWWIVLVAGIGMFMGYGAIYNYTYGVLTNPIGKEFNWSRSVVSLAYTSSLIAYSATNPFVGRLVDRFGARKVIVPSLILFSFGLMGFYFLSSELWYFFALNIALGLFGAGTGLVPYAQVIIHWFDKKRGLALGLAMIGTGLSAFVMPLVVFALIASSGWRNTYVYVGLMVMIAVIPVALFLREKPQMMGLLPDGVSSLGKNGNSGQVSGVSGRKALASNTFWIIFGAIFLLSCAVVGCLIHLVLMLTDRGMSAQMAAFAVSLLGGAVVPGRIVSGYLVDRFFAPSIAIYFFGAAGIGVFILWTGVTGAWAFVAAFLLGMGMGAEGELMAVLVSRYFGLSSFSEIYAYVLISFALGGIIGPPLMGMVFDRTGSYSVIMGVLVLSVLGSMALLRQLGPYPTIGSEENNVGLA